MGTNFYIKGHRHNDDPKFHIGKRSAAGMFCWDCNVTLCMGGNSAIHFSSHDWYKACPQCGKSANQEDLGASSAGRELGFNNDAPSRKTGVKSCSSFTWARHLGRIKKIEDEYGTVYTLEEFKAMLTECPVQFQNIGKWFC